MRAACGAYTRRVRCVQGLMGNTEGDRTFGRRRCRPEDKVRLVQKLESGKATICAHICLKSLYIILCTTIKKERDT